MKATARRSSDLVVTGSAAQLDRQCTMRSHVPELDKFLRDRGVGYVRTEYSGGEGQGGFEAPLFSCADGSPCPMDNAVLNLRIEDAFRDLLNSRYPTWLLGDGSSGDFRWDLNTDSLTHTHYLRGAVRERNTLHNI